MRLLLTQRRKLKRKFLDLENVIGHSLEGFGIERGDTSHGKFDAAVRAVVADDLQTAELMYAMLRPSTTERTISCLRSRQSHNGRTASECL